MPTIACGLLLDDGASIKTSVPAGTSVSDYAALELRDGDSSFYQGKGVLKALKIIETEIAPHLIGKEPDVFEIDKIMLELDGTPRKERFGANTTLAVSAAVLKAQAYIQQKEQYAFIASLIPNTTPKIPSVMFNVINGGKHATNNLCFQEFMIMPQGFSTFADALHAVVKVYCVLKDLCIAKDLSTGVGDEGGFVPDFNLQGMQNEYAALDIIMEAIEKAGYKPGEDFVLCLDVAASSFYDNKTDSYVIGDEKLTRDDMISLYNDLVDKYPMYSIEDGLAQHDWAGWQAMHKTIGSKVVLVGDDIFATNKKRIEKGLAEQVADAAIIKPNQVGTITETLDAIKTCKRLGGKTIISHRSGETIDTLITDLAVGTAADYFKAGAPVRGERVAKYNRLLIIEKSMGL